MSIFFVTAARSPGAAGLVKRASAFAERMRLSRLTEACGKISCAACPCRRWCTSPKDHLASATCNSKQQAISHPTAARKQTFCAFLWARTTWEATEAQPLSRHHWHTTPQKNTRRESPASTKLVALIFSAKSSTVVRTRGLCCPGGDRFGDVDAADRRWRTCRCCGMCAPPPAPFSGSMGAGARFPCAPAGLAKAAGSAMPMAFARSCCRRGVRALQCQRAVAVAGHRSVQTPGRPARTATRTHAEHGAIHPLPPARPPDGAPWCGRPCASRRAP
jgi:hypothetical protein